MYDGSTQHGYEQSSTIMNLLDKWYNDNLVTYETNYIDISTGFCSDRNTGNGYNWIDSDLYYASWNRQNGPATLQCQDDDILSKNNGRLQNPIGLITMDEAVLTDIKGSTANEGSYLYTGQSYWTMSPYDFSNGRASVFGIHSNVNSYWVHSSNGVRPVINLRSDIALSGSGTTTDPFRVAGADGLSIFFLYKLLYLSI